MNQNNKVTVYYINYGQVGEKVKAFATLNVAERDIKLLELVQEATKRISLDCFKATMTRAEFNKVLQGMI